METKNKQQKKNKLRSKVCHCGSGKLPSIMRIDLPIIDKRTSRWCCGNCYNDFKQCRGEDVKMNFEDMPKDVVGYVPDPEPICRACRQDRHEYCISKNGFECWCEEDIHG